MGIRESFNQNPRIVYAVVGVVLLGAISFLLYQTFSSAPQSFLTDQVFYTVDDGKTWFPEKVQPFPFEHQGKQAYQAFVVQHPGKPPFVAYLMRMSDASLKEVKALADAKDPDYQIKFKSLKSEGLEMRVPADPKWVPMTSASATKRIQDALKSSDGTMAEPVWP